MFLATCHGLCVEVLRATVRADCVYSYVIDEISDFSARVCLTQSFIKWALSAPMVMEESARRLHRAYQSVQIPAEEGFI